MACRLGQDAVSYRGIGLATSGAGSVATSRGGMNADKY